MKESIYTIPINEIFENRCGCPVCRIYSITEEKYLEYIMGAAMMEPDVRIEVNRLGFCKSHYKKMQQRRNRLSLALMLQSHLEQIQKDVFSKGKMLSFSGDKKRIYKVAKIQETCFICGQIEQAMSKTIENVFLIFEREPAFRELYSEQEFICLPHYRLLSERAAAGMNKKYADVFLKMTGALTQNYLHTLYDDVTHFTKMFDYRNSGEQADWGNAKDSIERAVAFLEIED